MSDIVAASELVARWFDEGENTVFLIVFKKKQPRTGETNEENDTDADEVAFWDATDEYHTEPYREQDCCGTEVRLERDEEDGNGCEDATGDDMTKLAELASIFIEIPGEDEDKSDFGHFRWLKTKAEEVEPSPSTANSVPKDEDEGENNHRSYVKEGAVVREFAIVEGRYRDKGNNADAEDGELFLEKRKILGIFSQSDTVHCRETEADENADGDEEYPVEGADAGEGECHSQKLN